MISTVAAAVLLDMHGTLVDSTPVITYPTAKDVPAYRSPGMA